MCVDCRSWGGISMICLPILHVLILEELAEAERHLTEQPEEALPLPPLWTGKPGASLKIT